MIIKVLGPGCKNCQKLYQAANEAVQELGVNAQIEKVEDIEGIISYGVMRTPGLVVDEVLKVSGRVPAKDEIKKIIEQAAK